MDTKTTHFGFIILLALTLGAGIVAYPQLPEQVASHWNAAGKADGYSGKFGGVFLFPALLAGLYLLYVLIPRIDPLKANIQSFRKHYNLFFLGIGGFSAYMFALSLAWNLGQRFDFGTAMLPACAIFLWLIGTLLEHAKRNWFVGIRTPWTLSSDKVWQQTHKLGARMFKIAAVVTLVGIPFGGTAALLFFIVPLLGVTVITVVYSYVAYLKK